MADGLILNFGVQRNEDYLREWQFFSDDDTDIDITGWSFALNINSIAGLPGSPLLSLGQVPTANGSVLAPVETASFRIKVCIKMEDTDSLPGRTADVVRYAFNFIATDGAGIRRADVRGEFIVEPGV